MIKVKQPRKKTTDKSVDNDKINNTDQPSYDEDDELIRQAILKHTAGKIENLKKLKQFWIQETIQKDESLHGTQALPKQPTQAQLEAMEWDEKGEKLIYDESKFYDPFE